jgi:hypothetical protein
MIDFLNSLVEGIQAMTGATRPGIVILMLMGAILQKLMSDKPQDRPQFS